MFPIGISGLKNVLVSKLFTTVLILSLFVNKIEVQIERDAREELD